MDNTACIPDIALLRNAILDHNGETSIQCCYGSNLWRFISKALCYLTESSLYLGLEELDTKKLFAHENAIATKFLCVMILIYEGVVSLLYDASKSRCQQGMK